MEVNVAHSLNFGNYDYIIIGAGSAGCVLANRLSADPNCKVCLIEAGGKDRNPWIHLPIGYFYTFDNPSTDWRFRTEPEPGLNGRVLKYPRGKVLGGSSSINGMVYIRGHERDYDSWAQMGNRGWSWDDVLPYFRRSEDHEKGESEKHGAGGELRVEGLRASWEILDAFHDAAIERGMKSRADFNEGNNEGIGYFQVTQKGGRRMSTARAFLRPARNRPNLTVLTKMRADKLIFENKRAVGIELTGSKGTGKATAHREVILSAGAVGSPHILQISGVGDQEALSDIGVPVIANLTGVGRNLQDHPALRTVYRVSNTRTLNEQSRSWFGKAKMGLEWLALRRGPLTIPPALVCGFARSKPNLEIPDLQIVCYPLSFDATGDPPHPYPGFTAGVCMVKPKSRGEVMAKTSNPADAPAIRLNFFSDPEDLEAGVAGVELIRRICSAPSMERYKLEETIPGAKFQSREEVAASIGNFAATIFHPVGTCKMGQDPNAVVDDRLRVHGLQGLRVVDASIMPTIINGNTNATTIMIAEKASDMIIEDAKATEKISA
tara:strand:- start:48104 stop:49750 length:1647 start_codon:yes stop_codon:yes gene_type:complete